MITWLVLLGLIGFVIHLGSRLRRLEERVEELQPATAYPFQSTEEAWAPDVAEEPASPRTFDASEHPHHGVVTHDESHAPELASEAVAFPGDESESQSRTWNLGVGFEDLFGRRLPIWAGGITLAVAGMLIVKLSIESGLLSPSVRVIAGLLFGAGLLASAELAFRFDERVRDPRVGQALAGAGVATLYASILVAVNLYELVDPFTAMLAMAAVTALALFLSTRFGPPSALLGLAGGLAAPALVGSTEPNVPLLSVYLALAVSGLCALSRSQRWVWLGISALAGGFGWGILLLIDGVLDTPSSISLGLYLLLLGVAIPALGFAGNRKSQLQLVAGIVAAAQLAALVATGGFALINWTLFAMLSIASIWLADRNPALVRLPAVGLLIALLLLGAWTSPSAGDFALVLAAFALIHATPAVRRLWQSGGVVEAAEIGAIGVGGLLLPMFHFHQPDGSNDVFFGLLALDLSLAVGVCAALGWSNPSRQGDARFALLGAVTAVLLAAAALLLLPIWLAGVTIGVIGLALLHVGQVAADSWFEPMAWVFAAAGVLAYPYSQVADGMNYPDPVDALYWTLQAAIAVLLAWRARLGVGRNVAQFLAPALLYGAAASVLSSRIEPLVAAALILATAWIARLLDKRLIPALASSTLIILIWAVSPLLFWSTGAAASLVGTPILVTDVPEVLDALAQLVIPGLAMTAAVLLLPMGGLDRTQRLAGWALAGVLTTVGVHSLYKQIFAIASPDAFVSVGLSERTIWEIALAGLAVLALRFGKEKIALVLVLATAAHQTFYTLLLHNPLWAAQAVGDWPIINLLLPVYGLAIGLAVAAKGLSTLTDGVRRGLDGVLMVLVVLFAFSELRQLFHGTLLTAAGLPVVEDILRSILAIALAVSFILWGITREKRDWRIASLVLMLAAVGKVFLFDASGLEGLARIASFIALGLSLIGIGWLYARHLSADRRPPSRAAA
jgi:uncharacterized membrane protein